MRETPATRDPNVLDRCGQETAAVEGVVSDAAVVVGHEKLSLYRIGSSGLDEAAAAEIADVFRVAAHQAAAAHVIRSIAAGVIAQLHRGSDCIGPAGLGETAASGKTEVVQLTVMTTNDFRDDLVFYDIRTIEEIFATIDFFTKHCNTICKYKIQEGE